MFAGSMPIRSGLRNLAFEHESGFGQPSTPKFVIDCVLQGKGKLEHLIEIERRKMRNPLYWIDRSLRALLGIPAYLISLIVGVPRYRLERGPWGPLLRVVAVAADVAGVWGVGRVLGWW